MPFITAAQQRIFYAPHLIPGSGHNLILVHGAGGSRLSWPAELRRLPGVSTFTIDLPGHGRSDPPGCTSVSAYADVLAAFIADLSLENVVVAGHSMGGAVAQELGLRQLPQICGLVLIGTGARLRVADAILGQVLVDFDNAASFITRYSWSPDSDQALIALSHQQLLQSDPTVVHGDFLACNEFDSMNHISKIMLPTLVVSGTLDKLTPLKFGQYLADTIPNAQLAVVEGGHAVALEQPVVIASHVASFVAQL